MIGKTTLKMCHQFILLTQKDKNESLTFILILHFLHSILTSTDIQKLKPPINRYKEDLAGCGVFLTWYH